MANNEDLFTVSLDSSLVSIECKGFAFLHDKSKGCRSAATSDEAGDRGDLLWTDRTGEGLLGCFLLAICGCLCWLFVVELDDEDEEDEEDDDEEEDEEDEDRVGDEDELGVGDELR